MDMDGNAGIRAAVPPPGPGAACTVAIRPHHDWLSLFTGRRVCELEALATVLGRAAAAAGLPVHEYLAQPADPDRLAAEIRRLQRADALADVLSLLRCILPELEVLDWHGPEPEDETGPPLRLRVRVQIEGLAPVPLWHCGRVLHRLADAAVCLVRHRGGVLVLPWPEQGLPPVLHTAVLAHLCTLARAAHMHILALTQSLELTGKEFEQRVRRARGNWFWHWVQAHAGAQSPIRTAVMIHDQENSALRRAFLDAYCADTVPEPPRHDPTLADAVLRVEWPGGALFVVAECSLQRDRGDRERVRARSAWLRTHLAPPAPVIPCLIGLAVWEGLPPLLAEARIPYLRTETESRAAWQAPPGFDDHARAWLHLG